MRQPNKCHGIEVEQTGASSQFYDKFSSSSVVDPVDLDRTDTVQMLEEILRTSSRLFGATLFIGKHWITKPSEWCFCIRG